MPQKLWNKYDRTFEAKGQKVKRWQKNSLYANRTALKNGIKSPLVTYKTDALK